MPLPPWVRAPVDRGAARVLEKRAGGTGSATPARAAPPVDPIDTSLPSDLGGMDDLCHRWSQQAFDRPVYAANPIYWMMKQAEGAALPGGEEVMQDDVLALDGVIQRSHEAVYALMYVWYCTGGSVEQKGARLGKSRSAFYSDWRTYLAYLRGRLHHLGVHV